MTHHRHATLRGSIVGTLLMLTVGASVALAAPGPTSGVHFTRNGDPICTVFNTGDSAHATCTSELAGLGEGDVTLSTILEGSAVYQCENNGGNIAPGQNKVLVGPAVDDTVVPGGQIKNGRARFNTSTADNPLTAPETVSGSTAGCPNPNWTGVNPTLSVTGITYAASQGGVELFRCSASGENLTGDIAFTNCTGAAV